MTITESVALMRTKQTNKKYSQSYDGTPPRLNFLSVQLFKMSRLDRTQNFYRAGLFLQD